MSHITKKEFASRLGISSRRLDVLARHMELPTPVGAGRHALYLESDVDEFLADIPDSVDAEPALDCDESDHSGIPDELDPTGEILSKPKFPMSLVKLTEHEFGKVTITSFERVEFTDLKELNKRLEVALRSRSRARGPAIIYLKATVGELLCGKRG